MPKRSKDVTAYIAAAPDFARPLLEALRAAYHEGCPKLEESLKWSVPHFDHEGIVCSFAAFKKHVTVGFWKGQRLRDTKGLLTRVGTTDMALMKLHGPNDLPSAKTIAAYVKEAAALNVADAKVAAERSASGKASAKAKAGAKTKAAAKKRVKVQVPEVLAAALKQRKHAKAAATFEDFSPTNRREYCEWIAEAKRDATRDKRLATALEWMAEGKPRNWKYDKRWGGC